MVAFVVINDVTLSQYAFFEYIVVVNTSRDCPTVYFTGEHHLSC